MVMNDILGRYPGITELVLLRSDAQEGEWVFTHTVEFACRGLNGCERIVFYHGAPVMMKHDEPSYVERSRVTLTEEEYQKAIQGFKPADLKQQRLVVKS